jgi:hypothetical protein
VDSRYAGPGAGTLNDMFTPSPFDVRRPGLVAPVAMDPRGIDGPTPGVGRGPYWRTTSRGLVVPADVAVTSQQRTLEASAVLGDDEAVTGWSALDWSGARWFDGTRDGVVQRDVKLVARRHIASQAGWRVSQEFLNPTEILVVDGVPITSHVRSVTFEMRYADSLGAAIEALDMACYSDLVSIAEVAAYVGQLGPVTGIQQARDAILEAEENSWSPRETRMRGVWTRRAGLARPRCNLPVFTLDGHHVGTPDLIDLSTGLVGLYHGDAHLSLVGASKDNRQDADFRDIGLEPVAMFATDWHDLPGFTRRLVAAAARAGTHQGARGWTIDPPAWWTPTCTVSLRRALSERDRARYLRYRVAA